MLRAMTVFMDETEISSYSDRSGGESERAAVVFESIFIHFVNTPTGSEDLRVDVLAANGADEREAKPQERNMKTVEEESWRFVGAAKIEVRM